MHQHRRRATAILAAVACTLAGCTSASGRSGPPQQQQPTDTPNLVFVLTDDLSSDLVQYMPHVAGLMRTGTTFSNYFVVDSLCCPSRSAILTGRYPHDTGVFTNQGGDGGYDAFNKHGNPVQTFAVSLHDAGYRTALMGKYLNGYRPTDPPAPGWDEWAVTGNGYGEYDYELNENGTGHSYGHDPEDYLTDVLSAKASAFIDSSADSAKPFALEVATFAPHQPWTPAPRDIHTFPTLDAPRPASFNRMPTDAPPWLAAIPPLTGRETRRIDQGYRKKVESAQAVDAMIGHLERTLWEKGLARNTDFVFSSDNGFHMGQYRLLPGKQTAFDTDIRVPLVITGPGVPAGRRVTAMASSIDLAPTFEELAGAEPAGPREGTSLVPLWRARAAPAGWQRAVLIEHHGAKFGPDDPDRQPVRASRPPSYEAIRTAAALYVEYRDGEREYYDLAHDPAEVRNLAATAPASRLAPLQRALHALAACHGVSACQAAARLG